MRFALYVLELLCKKTKLLCDKHDRLMVKKLYVEKTTYLNKNRKKHLNNFNIFIT